MHPDIELRCESWQLHGVLKDGLIEVKCSNSRCKQGRPNAVVFHYFCPSTGVLKDTKLFADPPERLIK